MKFIVSMPHNTIVYEDVKSITIQTTDGQRTFLPNQLESLVAISLAKGYLKSNTKENFVNDNGLLHVMKDCIVLITQHFMSEDTFVSVKDNSIFSDAFIQECEGIFDEKDFR